jgi:acetyl-CoA carboxylase carboxyl transferase subunit alpha
MLNLDFEQPIAELEAKKEELRRVSSSGEINIVDEVTRIEKKIERLLKETYGKLTPAQKVQVARHPNRPHTKDYIEALITDFQPLAGDRHFAEDAAIIGGLGRLNGQPVVVLGQERGNDTESRVKHNFGMAKPEGYRKAQRLLALADRFHLPVITLVDTAGAFPGVQAEERGQAEAIAKSIESCLRTNVPILTVVIGEGGSGGAIAIATADRVYMLEHAIYSVISPEGCASILWRSAANAAEAAAALRLTAQDLKQLGVIDDIIDEPVGGAHRDPAKMFAAVRAMLDAGLKDLMTRHPAALKAERRQKFLSMGSKGLS